MGESIINAHTSVVPIYSRLIPPGSNVIVYVSSISDHGHLVTVRDMDGYLSSPQAILISTTPGVLFSDGTSTLTLRQGFGYATLRSLSDTEWAIVDVNPLLDPSGAYDVRGVSYRSLTSFGLVQIRSTIELDSLLLNSSMRIRNLLADAGVFYVSTLAVNDFPRFLHLTADLNELIVNGALYVSSTVSSSGAVAALRTVNIGDSLFSYGSVSSLSNARVLGDCVVSSSGAQLRIQGTFSTNYVTEVNSTFVALGPLTLTNANMTRAVSSGTVSASQVTGGAPYTVSTLHLSTGTLSYVTLRADLTVVDPFYTGPTNPCFEIQPGLAVTSNANQLTFTSNLSVDYLQTGLLVSMSSITAVGVQAIEFQSTTILNSNGSLTISSIAAGTLAGSVSLIQPLPVLQPTTVQTSSFQATAAWRVQGTTSLLQTSSATTSSLTLSTILVDSGGVQLNAQELSVSTLTISSGAFLNGLSSLVLGAGTISVPSGTIVGSNVSTLATVTTDGLNGLSSIRSVDPNLLLSAPRVVANGLSLSSLLAQSFNASTFRGTSVQFGTPLSYSTISPGGPFTSNSTISGLTSNTIYEYVKGIGTVYDPLTIKASVDRTVNIYLNNISAPNSTFFLNAAMNYRNDGSASGIAGLRIVNAAGQSSILSFNANPIQTLQRSAISNYLIDTNLPGVSSTFYLNGPVTLQRPSTTLSQNPVLAAGTSGTTLGVYNFDGLLGSWSNFSTSSGNPFTGWNQLAWNGRLWVGTGSGTSTLAYSYDGLRWYGAGASIFTTAGSGLAWNGQRWVATGSGTNTLAISQDGVSWTGLGTSIFSTRGTCVAWNGTMFVAGGTGTNTIAVSYNGSNWTGLGTSVFTTELIDVAWGSNVWVGVGAGTSKMAKSFNGLTWSTLATQLGTQGEAIAWSGSRWVAGGGTGSGNQLAYSDDATTWTNVNISSILSTVTSVAWTGASWIATGARVSNTFATSPDAVSWSGVNPTTAAALSNGTTVVSRTVLPYGLSTSDYVIAGGTSSVTQIAYAENGSNWSFASVSSLSTIQTLAWNGRTWLAGGIAGTESQYLLSTPQWDTTSSVNVNFITSTSVTRTSPSEGWAYYTFSTSTTPKVLTFHVTSAVFARVVCGFVDQKNRTTANFRYAFYTNTAGFNISLYESGALPTISSYATTVSTFYTLRYTGSAIEYWVDNALFRTVAAPTYSNLTFAAWFQDPNSGIDAITYQETPVTPYPILGSEGGLRLSSIFAPFGYVNGLATNGFNWVAAGQAAYGNTLAVSGTGSNWIRNNLATFATAGRGVAWGSNKYVAVGEGSNTLAYSFTGSNWIGLGSNLMSTGRGVAWSGTRWVAVGTGPNTLLYSSDGITWTGLSTTVFSQQGNCVAWNGTLWIAGGRGTNTLATSPDGITWTGQGTTPFTTAVNSVAWSRTKWFIAGEGGTSGGTVFTSATGSNWIATLSTPFSTGTVVVAKTLIPSSITYEQVFVAVGDSEATKMAISYDGLTWLSTPNNFGTAFGNAMTAIAWNGTVWVAGGGAPVGSPKKGIYYSYDGINWGPMNSGFTDLNNINAIAWGLNRFIAVGQATTTNSWATSTDGINWTEQAGGTLGTNILGIAWGGNVWIATTSGGAPGFRYSIDNGSTWSNITVLGGGGGGMFNGTCAAYNGSLWVVGGDFSGIGYSTDGRNFRFLSGTTCPIGQVNALAYGNGVWVAVGTPGGTQSTSIAYSTDGSNWNGVANSSNTIFNYTGRGVAWNGKMFVAIGEHFSLSNTLAYSYDGSNWTGLGKQAFQGAYSRGHKIAARSILPNLPAVSTAGSSIVEGQMFTWSLLNMTKSSQTSVYKSGGTFAWDARASSVQGYTSNAFLQFQAGQTNGSAMMGFSETPAASASFTNLNYAVYLRDTGNAELYEFGVQVATLGAYTTSDVFRITYDGFNIRYYKNSTLLRTTARAIGNALYLSSSFYTPAAAIQAIEYHPLYTIQTSQPALSTTGFLYSEAAGTDVEQASPFYLPLTSNLTPATWTLYVTMDGTVPTSGTTFYGDVYFNETKIASTNTISPSYLTTSTYTLSFTIPSTFIATSNDTMNIRFKATRGAGATFLYTNLQATPSLSSVATRGSGNPGSIDYLQFFHTSYDTGLQTSELNLYLINASTSISTSYVDSNIGLQMNTGFVRWNSRLNTTTVRNAYNDTSTRSLTYTGAIYNASDPALKVDVEAADLLQLEAQIAAIPLRTFSFIPAYQSTFQLADHRQLGVLATDVAREVPNAVCTAAAPYGLGLSTIQTVDRQYLRNALLGVTKSLQERVSTLTARIQELRTRTT